MTTFDERERAFEAKYAHDAEMQFKAEARRNRLLGLWGAGVLGKSGEDALTYAMDVVKADCQGASDHDVFRKVRADLGDLVDDETLRRQMRTLMIEAKAQLGGE